VVGRFTQIRVSMRLVECAEVVARLGGKEGAGRAEHLSVGGGVVGVYTILVVRRHHDSKVEVDEELALRGDKRKKRVREPSLRQKMTTKNIFVG